MSYWSSVELPWQRCLGLAWEAYGAGSVPVGSVLTEADGMIVAEGRNRAFDTTAPDGELAGAYVAHAEINVLASLPPGDYPDHTLWSSLEPCFLCSAAILHSHVGNVRFARTDPVMSGVADLPSISAFAKSRWPERRGPVAGPLADFAGLVHLVWNLERSSDGVVAQAHQRTDPALLELAQRYVAGNMLQDHRNETTDKVFAAIWPDILSLDQERRSKDQERERSRWMNSAERHFCERAGECSVWLEGQRVDWVIGGIGSAMGVVRGSRRLRSPGRMRELRGGDGRG